MILVLGCGGCCYRAKGNVTKKIRMKNATPSNGGALAQTLDLIRKDEPINLGSVTYLKTIKNQDLKRKLIRELYYSELQMSGNLSRYFENFLGLRKPREKEQHKWTHPYLCSD